MIDRVLNTDALTKALIKRGHLASFSLTEREEMAAEDPPPLPAPEPCTCNRCPECGRPRCPAT